jgi:hypothetical protein
VAAVISRLAATFVPRWIGENPALPWGVLFIAVCVGVTQYGSTNAQSRYAALRAITERHVLYIDDYLDWTLDWAKAPNGHFYSNKAPGPVFLGLPVFALTDVLAHFYDAPRLDVHRRLPYPRYVQQLTQILCLQIIPFFVLVLWVCRRLQKDRVDPSAVHFFALASLFGNTAAIYMNSNFGHGVASLLFLGAVFFWYERRYLLTGMFLGFSLLSDYGVVFALPFFPIATLWRERKITCVVEIGAGAVPAAALWIWFHSTAFGSPFATANQFTNPAQGGDYSPVPSLAYVWRLLFSSSRGLLFTQPWVFAVFSLPFLPAVRGARGLSLLAVGSLAGLLWMNGGFSSWHGGWCVGPRYLSVVFPAMAFALALVWRDLPAWAHAGLWLLLGVALAFRILVFPFSNLAPEVNLWTYHLSKFTEEHSAISFVRLGMAIVFTGMTLLWLRHRTDAVHQDRDAM